MARSDRPRRGSSALLAASEVSLALVHVAVAVGFARLYESPGFLTTLLAFVVIAHGLAVVTRRARVPVPVAAGVAVFGAVLTTAWTVFPDTLALGLPTTATWDAFTGSLTEARTRFRVEVAPAPVLPGFQALAGLALWAAAWFSDWAAMRLRTTIEAVAPALVLFFFASLLGSGDHRLPSAVAFAAAVLLFVATHRAHRAGLERAWVDGPRESGAGIRSALAASGGLAVMALVVGALAAPRLPGHDDAAVYTWRTNKRSPESRTVTDPFVDIRSRLVEQANVELFQVASNREAYWRLTSLEDFDGARWTSNGLFTATSGDLPGTRGTAAVPSIRLDQLIEITGLRSDWVPAAYRATRVISGQKMRWSSDSGALITDEDEVGLVPGFVYEVESVVPLLGPDDLRAAAGGPGPDPVYLSLPQGIPPMVRDQAIEATAGASSDFDRALALQNWFRQNFEYDQELAPLTGDPMEEFLLSRVGYCEQFAGTYAAMARMLGIPARVAVGFTPGDQDPVTGRYVVRGRHAHAWPEVHLGEAGWVAFEPTPSRGIPNADTYTGVPPQQESAPSDPESTATSTTVPEPSPAAPTTAPTASPGPTPAVTPASSSSSGGGSGWLAVVVALGLVAAVWLVIVTGGPVLQRWRRRSTDDPGRRALVAWEEALVPVRWATGHRHRPSETHLEFARRSAPALGPHAAVVDRLAALATRASWDPAGVDPAEADAALSAVDELRSEAARTEPWGRRLRRTLSGADLRA